VADKNNLDPPKARKKMNSYQHILLAVDLAAAGVQQVALKAQELAAMNQAKLSVIYVVEIVPMMDVNYDEISPFNVELNEIVFGTAEKNLTEFADKLNIKPEHQWLEQGNPGEEIIRVADENQVNLIVLGSHGRHGWALLLGSTANAVLHHAHCDVLAVRLAEE
jgi:universal stress protein A